MGNGLFTDLKNWASQPFRSDMSLVNWILFVGLVLIASWIWSRVIGKITE